VPEIHPSSTSTLTAACGFAGPLRGWSHRGLRNRKGPTGEFAIKRVPISMGTV